MIRIALTVAMAGTLTAAALCAAEPQRPAAEFLGKGRVTFRLGGQGTAWVDDFVFAEHEPCCAPAIRDSATATQR